jgi:hypothetical protein
LFLAGAEFDLGRVEEGEVVHLTAPGDGLALSMDCTLGF